MGNLNEHDVLFLGSDEFEGLAQKIQEHYDLAVHSYDLPPFVSFTSRKAVLHTDKGSYFLKEKPEYCSSAERRNEAANFQNYLSDKMSVVPQVLRTREGEHYIDWNGRFLFLTEYKPGRVFNGSKSDISEVLGSLKEMLILAKDYQTQGSRSESYELIIPLELLENFVHSKEDEENFASIKAMLESLRSEYLEQNNVKYVMSHGDFSLFNVLFDGSKLSSINDFDNAQKFPRIQDLAEFLISSTLINYLAPLSNLKYPIYLKPDEPLFRQILDSYIKDFDLTKQEVKLFPILTDLVWADILLLAVLKEDYPLADIMPAIECIKRGDLRKRVSALLEGVSKKVFIWDFHGTLETGTIQILCGIANELLRENGSDKQYEVEWFANQHAFSWRSFFSKELPGLNEREIKSVVEEAYNEERFKPLIEKYSVSNQGAVELLTRIKETGGINIVVSNSRQDKLAYYISVVGLESLIDECYGVDDGTIKSSYDVVKRKVDVTRSILEKHSGTEVYISGDGEMDVMSARLLPVNRIYWVLDPERKKVVEKGMNSERLKCVESLSEITEELFI